MSKIDDRTRLLHIKDGATTALSFMDGKTREDLDRDRMLSFAIVRCLEIIGEAANRVSDDVQQKYPLIRYFLIASQTKISPEQESAIQPKRQRVLDINKGEMMSDDFNDPYVFWGGRQSIR